MLVDDERAMEVRTKHAVATQTTTQTMTNDNIRTKANAVFFAAIMVVSMVAVGFAAAPAAAAATSVSASNADDVTANADGVQQEVTVEATVADATTDTLTIDTSQVRNAGGIITDASEVSNTTSTDDGQVNSVSVNNDGNVEVVVEDTGSADSASVDIDVVVQITHDLSNVAGGSTVTYTVSDSADSNTDTVSFDVLVSPDIPNSTTSDRDENADGDVFVTDGNTVFQGEEDIRFYNTTTNTEFDASDLEGTSGNREGTPLQMPIPEDEETGTYDTNGESDDPADFSTTVVEPRITTAEVQLEGDDIDQIAASRANNEDDRDFGVQTEFNFEEAENVEITVEDPSGADITNAVLDESEDDAIVEQDGLLRLDMSDEDAGEYTVIFEGDDDLDFDGVIEEYTFELTNEDTLSIDTAEDSVTRGDDLDYTISGGTNGDYHLVQISSDDFRDDLENTDSVFRNVGDTSEVGYAVSTENNGDFFVDDFDDVSGDVASGIEDVDAGDSITPNDADYAYAIVEIDGTQGVGAVETQYLDDTSVDIDVYTEDTSPAEDRGVFYDIDDQNSESEDDVSFDVDEGSVTLDSPTGDYVVGEEVDVNGTASSADDVRIYVRDNDDWEPVEIDGSYTISVDSDDTFEETDVDIRDGNGEGNNLLEFAGRYDIGAIDDADVTDDIVQTTDGESLDEGSIDTSDFSSAESTRETIDVRSGDLTANFGFINGQVAQVDNEVNVNGTAAGQDDVLVVFVDNRGRTVTEQVSVDSDETFDEDDISLTGDEGDLRQGTVSAHVISLGRDGDVGDGEEGTNTLDDLETEIDGFEGSGDQVRSRILANTVEDDGSDDLIVTETFRLNDATLSIDNVYPEEAQADGVNPVAAGETLVVEGTTNRDSDDAAITFEVLDENDNSVASGSTDEWGTDGQFSATIDTSDIETGSYVLEADDGESTDRVTVEIVESVEEETTEEETEEETTEEETTEEETTEEETEEETTEEETTEEETTEEETEEEATDDSTPGFGALVALVALVAAALLATRRRDE